MARTHVCLYMLGNIQVFKHIEPSAEKDGEWLVHSVNSDDDSYLVTQQQEKCTHDSCRVGDKIC